MSESKMKVKKLLIAATLCCAPLAANAWDIVETAMAADNGVIHAIDTVLMPK